MKLLQHAPKRFYGQWLRGSSKYRSARRYELVINCLFMAALLGLLVSALVATFDNQSQNDSNIYGLLIFTAALVMLWWLSRSGRHAANARACLTCSIVALVTVLTSSRSGMPSVEIGVVLLVSFIAMILELRFTRAELQAERDALEQRVIERTEQLEAEQLRRTLEMQKFAEFGRLSAQLLHDVANPLTVASLHLEQADNHTSHAIREARRSLKHLEQYVQSARHQLQQTGEIRAFNVQKELRQLLLILKPVAQKAGVKIVLSRAATTELQGDPVRFHQVMANVIANAIDACSSNGSRKNKGAVTIKITELARYIQITVHDNGSGIPSLELPKIFEPFYTTKSSSGRGLGIGLSTVKRALRETFSGTICVQSTPQTGTTFTLLFRAQRPLTLPEESVERIAQSQPAMSILGPI